MKNTKYFAIALAALLGMSSIPVNAAAGPMGISASGDIGVFNQYIWRGAPQNTNKAAVQGDVSLSVPVGPGDLSASVWGSNTFASPAPQFSGQDAIEFDWTLDYSLSLGDFGFSVGDIYYTYLRDSTANFDEIYAGTSYDGDALLGIHPFFTAYYTVADSSITVNNLNEKGDVWMETGATGSVAGVDLSGMVSFAVYKSDPTRVNSVTPTTPAGSVPVFFDNGPAVVTLGMSKDFKIADVTITPSFTVYVPVSSKAPNGKRFIYSTESDTNVVLGVNAAF